ncbi:MAG: metalloregulator ArsR/SmtB family transcription factor [Nanoarchaeota archaeon]|nr:metalloregulator ArsR/SmtB family transcription factor [Nanoarchaeota archaeon]
MSGNQQPIIILKALSDNTRLKIIQFLLNGEKCVCEIFPNVKRTQSTVSIQLNVLEKAKIIKSRREGKWVYYQIVDKKVLEIFKLLGLNKQMK